MNMKVEQIYTGCLAQGAYYIESNGEVAIIDPLREVQTYIDMAQSRDAKIKYIFETHFHADFVSGHVTLSEKRMHLSFLVPMPILILNVQSLRMVKNSR